MRTRSLLILIFMLIVGFFALSFAVGARGKSADIPRPTATPGELPAGYEVSSPAAPDALPDLVVDGIRLSPHTPYVNEKVTVYVTIKNVGTADVEPGNNFYLDFYVNPPTDDLRGLRGDKAWQVQGHQMGVGQSAIFSWTFEFEDVASYNLWAQVDTPELNPDPPNQPRPYGWVLESNEDNNILGPEYVSARTHGSWVQKDHVDFFLNMASTLDVVPVTGTVGIITNTPGLVVHGDSALALGIFDEPPPTSTWGLPSIPPGDMPDYNMINPDFQLNQEVTNYQQYPSVHASGDLVVAVWEDGQNGPTYGKDVFLRWSEDKGETWEDPIQVNETFDNHDRNDQTHPTVAVAPDGRIVVAWQDHRDESFDIYVQVFDFTGTDLIACQSNGDCASACDLTAEACNFRVDTGANNKDQILPDIAVDELGTFFVAWQDQRNGNDDVFAVRSYTSTVDCPTSAAGRALLPYSSPKQGPTPDQIYLCWGDDTRIHDDPSTTKQASPSIDAVNGLKITGIDYEIIVIDPGPPPVVELVVTHVYSEPTTFVVVTWEDEREGDDDIYLVYSDDVGETYSIDRRLNDDKPANTSNGVAQVAPATAINQWMKVITIVAPTPYGPAQGEVKLPVTTMHIVWQDFRNSTDAAMNNDPDIYYEAITIEPDENWPWPLVLTAEGQQKVNQNDWRSWQTEPVWQGEPDVDASASGLVLEESDGYNAFVIWADGRNYGGEFPNTDVYFRLISNVGAPSELIGGNNIALNDGVRLHDFDTSNPAYNGYRRDVPPHGRQRHPSIASTLIAEWPTIYDGYLHVVWDDDRIGDPFEDRNVYYARSCVLYGGHCQVFDSPLDVPGKGEVYASGAFVSEVFDSVTAHTRWYTIDWHAWTDSGTYITLQTRMGNTREAVLNSDWYPKEFPYPDDAVSVGSPLQGYDAPGQHIEDAAGNHCPENCPQARYIQYRVNFWARNSATTPTSVVLRTPFLYDVILHYENSITYLPIVLKNQ